MGVGGNRDNGDKIDEIVTILNNERDVNQLVNENKADLREHVEFAMSTSSVEPATFQLSSAKRNFNEICIYITVLICLTGLVGNMLSLKVRFALNVRHEIRMMITITCGLEGVLQHENPAHIVALLPDCVDDRRRRVPHHALHRLDMPRDRRPLEPVTAHQHH